jgi:hypothetical protein
MHNKRIASPRSRSQKRRIAAQKGEPAPEFNIATETVPVETESPTITVCGPVTPSVLSPFATEPATEDMSAEELDAWFDNVMKGVKA